MNAIQLIHPGGPEELQLRQVHDAVPGVDEVLIEVFVSGVNFIDIYVREGRYPNTFPLIPGQEGAGVVVGLGPGVVELKLGDRVAWCSVLGTYSEYAVVPASRVVRVPDGLKLELAAAVLLQGMTAHYLTRSAYEVRPGNQVLIHAGAGGVGLLLTQMANSLGAAVTTTVSSPFKAELSRAAGANSVIFYGDAQEANYENVIGRMHAAYDSVGLATFRDSIRCLRDRGTAVLYGTASGAVPRFDLEKLAHGSYFVTRPILKHYTATSDELRWRASEVFRAVLRGELKVLIGKTYDLSEAGIAHEDLYSRRTVGKLLLKIRSE